jgi:hypothetical protein
LIDGNISLINAITKLALHTNILKLGGAIFEGATLIGAIAQFAGTRVTRTVVFVSIFEEARSLAEDADVNGFGLGAALVLVFEALEETVSFARGGGGNVGCWGGEGGAGRLGGSGEDGGGED